ncbi:MAG: AsnC family transcriptional regulator [Nitrososphaera sp.]|nr:AsnC family transcriptional regulator [Nitrososphaera sp.]
MLPVQLDDTDAAIINSLMQDGRKSFRAISREIKVSTPTVKARYDRLVNIGLIKSVKPEIDLAKIDKGKQPIGNISGSRKKRVVKDLKIKIACDYCAGPINGQPKVLKFADIQRFFCCTACRSIYKEKHEGRIQSVIEQYKERKKASSEPSSA